MKAVVKKNKKAKLPDSIESFRARIIEEFPNLSKRLKEVGQYVLDNPNDIALETLAVIARRCEVQPSTFVRFANYFGFDGASQMQKLYRNELYSGAYLPSYEERVRRLKSSIHEDKETMPLTLIKEFATNSIIALEHLIEEIDPDQIQGAVDLIRRAESVHVIGLQRSFPVAAYITYTLHRVKKRVHLIDGVAGLLNEQASLLTPKDLLIAISFHPYTRETESIVAAARETGASVVAISDSLVSPIARKADIAFKVHDAEARGFRSLTATLCLAQAIIIGYACEQDVNTR